MGSAGNGPICPINPRHGKTLSWSGKPGHDWFCGNQGHGGNGRFFSDQEIHVYEMTEGDIMNVLESAAREVAAGTTDLDTAVRQVAKQTKRNSNQVRDQINETVAAIQASVAEREAAEKEAQVAKETKAAKPAKAPKAPKEPTLRNEHVEPAEFAAVRDAAGMRNKEVSAALEAAGLGSTLSRVTELTHSKGSSRALFVKFSAAIAEWREANPAVAEAPAAE